MKCDLQSNGNHDTKSASSKRPSQSFEINDKELKFFILVASLFVSR